MRFLRVGCADKFRCEVLRRVPPGLFCRRDGARTADSLVHGRVLLPEGPSAGWDPGPQQVQRQQPFSASVCWSHCCLWNPRRKHRIQTPGLQKEPRAVREGLGPCRFHEFHGDFCRAARPEPVDHRCSPVAGTPERGPAPITPARTPSQHPR